MADFFGMDGYGVYIWPAYTASIVTLVTLYLLKSRALRRALRDEERETSKTENTPKSE